MVFSAGFDFSSADAVFAVVDSAKGVLFDRAFPFPARDASALPMKIHEVLEDCGLLYEDIADWSIGTGPGSFTGLRIAAAFAAGLTFRRNGIRIRGVSSAAALAHTLYAPDQPVLTLYDGRKNEILACGLHPVDGFFREDGFRAVIRSAADLAGAAAKYPALACLDSDKTALEKVCPGWGAVTGFAERIFAATLAAWDRTDFSRKPSELTYLRPAVFVPPSVIRSV